MSEETFSTTKILIIGLILAVGVVYYSSNPKPQYYYNYTFRVAEQFFTEKLVSSRSRLRG